MAPLTTCIIREVFLGRDGKRKQAPFTLNHYRERNAHLLNVNIRFLAFLQEKSLKLYIN